MFFLVSGIILLVIIFWILVISAMALMVYGGATTKVPFVPVPHFVLEALKKEMPLKAGDVLYDLGSGDGRVVLGMAATFPGAVAVGIDKAPFPYLLSRFNLRRSGAKNARFLYKNFADVPLTDATHIYMYLYPETVQKLLPKFEQELRAGAVVVSCDFPFTDREALKTVPVVRGRKKYTLYFYNF